MLKKAVAGFVSAVVLFLWGFNFPLKAEALSGEDLSAYSAVLYCPDTKEIVFEKNKDDIRSMASTTKIMTSLIALEQNTPYRTVTITEEMVNVEGTSSGLRAEDKIKLIDLVYCMLLESGNDAANACAVAIGGSFEGFAEMMNKRAGEIGMENTNFVTPSGLDDENHYTTCYDMALLTAEALKNEAFKKICSEKTYTVTFEDSDKTVTLYNHNKLLGSYEGCIGVKTGFTKKSGRCLVSAAERNGVTLIAVTLNASDDWNDHEKMLDRGFSLYDTLTFSPDVSGFRVAVTGGQIQSVSTQVRTVTVPYLKDNGEPEISFKAYTEQFLYSPVKKGDVIGFGEIYLNGEIYCRIPLTAGEDCEITENENNKNKSFFERIKEKFLKLFD